MMNEPEIISSVKNPKAVLWRSLKEAKGRKEHGAFLVEGLRLTGEALASSFPVQAVLLRKDFRPEVALPEGVPVFVLEDHVFASVCDTVSPQGIAAVLTMAPRPAEGPRLLALDGIQDPGNLGTIVRTADAAGFTGLLMSRDCVSLFSPKVLRSAMGSVFRLGFDFPPSLSEALEAKKKEGFDVLSSQLDGDPFFERGPVSPSFVLVIGNEGNGVSEPVRRVATHHLRLPMAGGAESLNAAVAAGIMMYDLMRSASVG